MKAIDLQYKEIEIPKTVGLLLQSFDLIVCAFKRPSEFLSRQDGVCMALSSLNEEVGASEKGCCARFVRFYAPHRTHTDLQNKNAEDIILISLGFI